MKSSTPTPESLIEFAMMTLTEVNTDPQYAYAKGLIVMAKTCGAITPKQYYDYKLLLAAIRNQRGEELN